jgi:hypothetical protein
MSLHQTNIGKNVQISSLKQRSGNELGNGFSRVCTANLHESPENNTNPGNRVPEAAIRSSFCRYIA